ncbi:MAG: ABC transporter permease subunit [Candidatus Poseidoniaceae archaeon]|nr:ABC transporter permease subunit [Candidatus Poseidoniaceae archaeon]
MSSRMDTIWAKLDRKSTAIAEFTMRQYRTRISTWVVMIASALALFLMLLFYIEAMNTEIEAIDNDGDSFDTDGDGYPDGQERLEGTNPNSAESFPDWVEPDPPEKWINEDDIDWEILGDGENYVGNDDDGDCTNLDTSSQRDSNDNGRECDILVTVDALNSTITVDADANVDEDPDEEKYGKEAGHRSFILGIGKFGIVYLLGIFLPLFLATGLIREEMSEGTIHYMLAKPIARGELLLYRMLGYIGITWPFIISICVLLCLITGFTGPGDGFFRWSDIGVWMSIAWATMLVSLVYGTIFCGFGIIWKNGVILAIIFAAWELGMAFVAIFSGGDSSIRYMSVIGWGMIIVDAGVAISWPDNWQLIEIGLWGGGHGEENWLGEMAYVALPAAEPLAAFSGSPNLGVSNWLSFLISTLVLVFQGAMFWFIGQSIFKGKEVD